MDVTEMTETLRNFLTSDGPTRIQEHDFLARMREFETLARLTFKGRLDPEAGAAFRTALDGLSAPRPAEDGTRDSRSVARRQADALVEFLYQGLEAGYLPMS